MKAQQIIGLRLQLTRKEEGRGGERERERERERETLRADLIAIHAGVERIFSG